MVSVTAEFTGVPNWQSDSDAQNCSICNTKFNLWFRRHHCRMCGRVVCGNCSPSYEKYLATSYVVSPPNQPFLESPHIPHRTCTECLEELQMIRRALSQSPVPQRGRAGDIASVSSASNIQGREFLIQNVVPGADNDYLGRCPVCDKQLFQLPEAMQETHVNSCLMNYSVSPSAGNSVTHQRKRMLISKLSEKECLALGDCMICYEDFEPGKSVGRLECLCVFHEKCIFDWFSRKGVGLCPLHNQSN